MCQVLEEKIFNHRKVSFQVNSQQADQILTLLNARFEAVKGLEAARRHRQDAYGPGLVSLRQQRIEVAAQRLDSLAVPAKDEAIEACKIELTRLGEEFSSLQVQLIGAIQQELTIAQNLAACRVRLRYLKAYPVLRMPIKSELDNERQISEELNKAEYLTRVISGRRAQIQEFVALHYPAASLADQQTFQAAAVGRVDALLGEHYRRSKAAALLANLGLGELPGPLAGLAG